MYKLLSGLQQTFKIICYLSLFPLIKGKKSKVALTANLSQMFPAPKKQVTRGNKPVYEAE